jgi:hypothetical protein
MCSADVATAIDETAKRLKLLEDAHKREADTAKATKAWLEKLERQLVAVTEQAAKDRARADKASSEAERANSRAADLERALREERARADRDVSALREATAGGFRLPPDLADRLARVEDGQAKMPELLTNQEALDETISRLAGMMVDFQEELGNRMADTDVNTARISKSLTDALNNTDRRCQARFTSMRGTGATPAAAYQVHDLDLTQSLSPASTQSVTAMSRPLATRPASGATMALMPKRFVQPDNWHKPEGRRDFLERETRCLSGRTSTRPRRGGKRWRSQNWRHSRRRRRSR